MRKELLARIIIVSVSILISAAAPQPSGTHQPKQAATQANIAKPPTPIPINIVGPVEMIEPPTKQPPCGPGQYQSGDDLCAQWKAADAAGDAARWTMLSALLSALALVGVFVTFRETRRTANAAIDGVNEAKRAADVAERTLVLTQRPQIAMKDFDIAVGRRDNQPGDWDTLTISLRWANVGSTTALDVAGASNCLTFATREEVDALELQAPDFAGDMPRANIFPTAEMSTTHVEVPRATLNSAFQGQAFIVVVGTVSYRDYLMAVDAPAHITQFCGVLILNRDPNTLVVGQAAQRPIAFLPLARFNVAT